MNDCAERRRRGVQVFRLPPLSPATPVHESQLSVRASTNDRRTVVGDDSEDTRQPHLYRHHPPKLSVLLLTGIMYTFAVGGAYGIEESVLGGGALLTLLSIVLIPLLIALPTALVVAELSAAVPTNAGFLMWIHLTFHPVLYLVMVILSLFLIFTDNALYPVLFSEYVCAAFGCSSRVLVVLLRLAMIGVTFILNVLGVEVVGFTSVGLTVVSVLPFFLMFVVHLLRSGFYLNWAALATIPADIHWAGFIATASWNLSGLEQAGAVAEEVRDPQHTLVRALLALLALAVVTYAPPVLVGASVSPGPLEPARWQTGFWTEVAGEVGGAPLRALLTVGSVVSALGLTLSALLTTSHIMAGMALTEAIPGRLGQLLRRRHTRYGTYYLALAINSALTGIFSCCLDFEPLVLLDQVLYGVRILCIFVAFFRFRSLYPFLKRPFTVPLPYKVTCVYFGLCVAANLMLIVIFLLNDWFTFLFCALLFVGSCVFSYIYYHYARKRDFLGSIVFVNVSKEDEEENDGNGENDSEDARMRHFPTRKQCQSEEAKTDEDADREREPKRRE